MVTEGGVWTRRMNLFCIAGEGGEGGNTSLVSTGEDVEEGARDGRTYVGCGPWPLKSSDVELPLEVRAQSPVPSG